MEYKKMTEDEIERAYDNVATVSSLLGEAHGKALLGLLMKQIGELPQAGYDPMSVPQVNLTLTAALNFVCNSIAPFFTLLHKTAIENGVKGEGVDPEEAFSATEHVIAEFWEQVHTQADKIAKADLNALEEEERPGMERAEQEAAEALNKILSGMTGTQG